MFDKIMIDLPIKKKCIEKEFLSAMHMLEHATILSLQIKYTGSLQCIRYIVV